MKLILATIPIRERPSGFPPVGATALLDTLIGAGYEPKFYDINTLRPDFEEVIDYFRREQPDILGISAVVSTAYRYTKELSHAVKQVSPKTKIIVGGCLAASAEILLRRCSVDVCVIGEGEKVLMNLVKYWEKFGDLNTSREEIKAIKGITFVHSNNNFIFTGYEKQLLPEELLQPNYDLVKKYSDINCYIRDPFEIEAFARDSRSRQPQRRGQRSAFVMTGKGCINRCTFCHRWIKGYRSYPVDGIINTMKSLKERYNVGFFEMGDESFGINPKALDEFIEAVRPLDILFRIGAMGILKVYRRPELIRKLKEIGCVQINFGMESGSDKILRIMGKGVTRVQNTAVGKLLSKEHMYTIHQFIIGMPGENDNTIKETIGCVNEITEDAESCPYNYLSINYFQSLPGTPGYEYMRQRGLIGRSLKEEEAYLLDISDVDAGSRAHYKNVSENSIEKVLYLWPYKIKTEATINWYKHHGWKALKAPQALLPSNRKKKF